MDRSNEIGKEETTTMQRITDEDGSIVGRFDETKAESFEEGTYFNGSNHISLATGSQWDHNTLYHTAGDKWILHYWSQWQGSKYGYMEIKGKEACEWFIKNEHDDLAEEFFPDISEKMTIR